ncbi:hemerythrin domain-containing protein [Ramlibacter sp.]|uniref:hemerythrin domain-containing protein n=1 Tax=Ramlibacter sp. TaxID=1917967 RepID=UPI002FC93916
MKRSPALIPLSREHHEALVLARRACEPDRPGADPAGVREQVLRRWSEHIEAHFRLEEQALLPALRQAGAPAEADEGARQHRSIRRLVDELESLGTAALPAWGDAMREHVQWEERHLFPLAERLLDLPALSPALAGAPAASAP